MKKSRKILSLILSVAVLVTMVGGSFMTAGAVDKQGKTVEKNSDAIYESMSILGDSICLGFSVDVASMTAMDTFDVVANAENNKYPWSYPSQTAEKLGLDPQKNLRNFGVCAAWSNDIKDLVTDPFYKYSYDYSVGLDDSLLFELPKSLTLTAPTDFSNQYDPNYANILQVQVKVDGVATGFDVSTIKGDYTHKENVEVQTFDYYTYTTKTSICDVVYVYDIQNEDGTWNGCKEGQTLTLDKGTKVKMVDYSYGYASINPILLNNFNIVSSDCYDENGYPVDKNKDGKFNEADFTYLPYTTGFDWTTFQSTYTVYKDEAKTVVADPEDYCVNPLFNTTYVSRNSYDSQGKIKDNNGDGVANIFDVKFYPYSTTTYDASFNTIVTVYTDASMTETVPESEWVTNPDNAVSYYKYITDNLKNSDLIALAFGGNDIMHTFLPYCTANQDNELVYLIGMLMSALMTGTDFNTILTVIDSGMLFDGEEAEEEEESTDLLSTVFTLENIIGFLDYFSEDSINELFKSVIENYPVNLDGTVQAVKEINPDAQLVALSHYNPLGVTNFFNMLSQDIQSGLATQKLSDSTTIVLELVSALLGAVGSDSEMLQDMSDEEIENKIEMLKDEAEGATTGGIDIEALFQLVIDMSFPVSVAIFGTAFEDTYTSLNNSLKAECEKNDIVFVDITECPSNGKVDPHPGEEGHTWIANKLYDAIVPEVTVSAENGTIKLSEETKHAKVDGNVISTRLHNDLTFDITPADDYVVSGITVDGKAVSQDVVNQAKKTRQFVLEDVAADKSVTATFVKCDHKYEQVTTKAGAKDGKIETKCSNCGKVTNTVVIPAVSIELAEGDYTYTGEAIEPAVTVVGAEEELAEGTDYEVAYKNNIDAGTATVEVTLDNEKYAGTITKEFTIDPAAQTVKVNKTSYTKVYRADTFNLGAKAKTDVTYKSSNTKVATVDAEGNVKAKGVGKCTITATAIAGNYKKATKKVTITVKPRKAYIKSVTVGTKKMTVNMKYKASTRGTTYYQIAYKPVGSDTWKKVSTSKQKLTRKNLVQGKKYQVKVRAYKKIDGKAYYGAWSTVKTTNVIK